MTNALRLNLMNIHDASKDRKSKKAIAVPEGGRLLDGERKKADTADNQKQTAGESAEGTSAKKGETEMTKTMKIEGMMCMHCEARVKKALEALEQVTEAQVSHESGTAVVTLAADVDNAVLTKAVEDQDYKVLSVE